VTAPDTSVIWYHSIRTKFFHFWWGKTQEQF